MRHGSNGSRSVPKAPPTVPGWTFVRAVPCAGWAYGLRSVGSERHDTPRGPELLVRFAIQIEEVAAWSFVCSIGGPIVYSWYAAAFREGGALAAYSSGCETALILDARWAHLGVEVWIRIQTRS